METSTQPSQTQLPKINKIFAAIFLILGILGFLDASYLTLKHLRGELPNCTVVHGCDKVLTSRYATIGRVPVALLGVLNYTLIVAGAILYLDLKNKKIIYWLSFYTIFGVLASAYFIFLQFVVLKALCLYCLISAAISILIFASGVAYLTKYSK